MNTKGKVLLQRLSDSGADVDHPAFISDGVEVKLTEDHVKS